VPHCTQINFCIAKKVIDPADVTILKECGTIDGFSKYRLAIIAARCLCNCERQWPDWAATGETSVIQGTLADEFIGVDPKGKPTPGCSATGNGKLSLRKI
jgi:hypothetical protein